MANQIFINTENWQRCYDVTDINLMSCLTYFTVSGVSVSELFPLFKDGIISSIDERGNGVIRVSVHTKYITEIK